MSSEPPPSGVELVRCPGCGRQVVGSIQRCTYCKMELGLSAAPPVAAPKKVAGTDRCALCGLTYDASSHDACPHCTERFGRREREALDAHQRGRKAGDLVVWIAAAVVLTAIGAVAHWGAAFVAPTLGAGSLWQLAVAGGVIMGALAGWRLRERSSLVESVIAVLALSAMATQWLRAALIWANGFNLSGDPQQLACRVSAREGEHTTVICVVAGEPVDGTVPDDRAVDDAASQVRLAARRGRLGYWVASSAGLRSVDEEAEDGVEGDALDE